MMVCLIRYTGPCGEVPHQRYDVYLVAKKTSKFYGIHLQVIGARQFRNVALGVCALFEVGRAIPHTRVPVLRRRNGKPHTCPCESVFRIPKCRGSGGDLSTSALNSRGVLTIVSVFFFNSAKLRPFLRQLLLREERDIVRPSIHLPYRAYFSPTHGGRGPIDRESIISPGEGRPRIRTRAKEKVNFRS